MKRGGQDKDRNREEKEERGRLGERGDQKDHTEEEEEGEEEEEKWLDTFASHEGAVPHTVLLILSIPPMAP